MRVLILLFLLLLSPTFAVQDELENDIKQAVEYLNKKIIEAPVPENKEDMLYIRALKDVRAFLTGGHFDGERAMKALLFIKKYAQERNYSVFSRNKIEEIKLLIEALIKRSTIAFYEKNARMHLFCSP
ncbi:hypothetical protein [Persephonella sp.]